MKPRGQYRAITPDEDAEIRRLRDHHDLRLREIAKRVGRSIGAVCQSLKRTSGYTRRTTTPTLPTVQAPAPAVSRRAPWTRIPGESERRIPTRDSSLDLPSPVEGFGNAVHPKVAAAVRERFADQAAARLFGNHYRRKDT